MRCSAGHIMCSLLLVFFMCVVLASETTTSVLSASTNSTHTTGTGNDTTNPNPKKWNFLSDDDNDILTKTAMSVAALGALLNFIVIIVMTLDPLKILRKGHAWITILNLAIADFISCVFGFCLFGRKYFAKSHDYDLIYKRINAFGWGFGSAASFFVLTFFMVQIFAITKFPLKSRSWFQTRKVVSIIIVIWFLAFLLGLCYVASEFFTGIETIFNIYITRIAILQVAVLVQLILNIQVVVEIVRSGRNVGNPQNKHKVLAITVIILTTILFFTAFPYFTIKQLEFIARSGRLGDDKWQDIFLDLSRIYLPIALLNFAVNPILYSLRLPDYRRTLVVLVCKRQRKKFSPMTATSTKQTNVFSLRSQRTSDNSREKK
ncbi:succinate receptor 1-like [Dendronephthya gigantea]|uniref:succinate receptor 1-like n=1 Tax=Dendronephthya gigantea TaxID=151771 RepID=UPI00106A32CF|nr:succinate receptor 1-like [Dendronephthya gigantea]